MKEITKCPLCGLGLNETLGGIRYLRNYDVYSVNCDRCGKYSFSEEIYEDFLIHDNSKKKRPMLSSYTRERTIFEAPTICFLQDASHSVDIPNLIPCEVETALKYFPQKVSDRIDRVLLNLCKLSMFAGEPLL